MKRQFVHEETFAPETPEWLNVACPDQGVIFRNSAANTEANIIKVFTDRWID